VKELFVEATEGRKLRVVEAGDPNGKPVIYLHGTPSSRVLDPRWIADASHQGVRLIGYDRPGCGGSTPWAGRRVADAAADVGAIADQLDLPRIAVWGISGGGPHALACAALLPSRCVGAAVLESPAPPEYGPASRDTKVNKHVSCEPLLTPQEQQNWKDTHREKDTKSSRAMLSLLGVLASDRRSLKRGVYRLLMPLYIGRAEAKALSRESAQWVVSSLSENLRQGVGGGQDDEIAIYHQAWGFELASIRVPVLLWHGEQDQFVSIREGRWLATRIPKVEARLTPDDGHVSIAEYRIPEVHRWLLGKFADANSPHHNRRTSLSTNGGGRGVPPHALGESSES
jgi:pimeloyl-ACP methyl ester carboxylesterase